MLVYEMLMLFHSHFISTKLPSESLHTSKGDRRDPGSTWSGLWEHRETSEDVRGDGVREITLSNGSQKINTRASFEEGVRPWKRGRTLFGGRRYWLCQGMEEWESMECCKNPKEFITHRGRHNTQGEFVVKAREWVEATPGGTEEMTF